MEVSTHDGSAGSTDPVLVQTKLFPPHPAGRTLARRASECEGVHDGLCGLDHVLEALLRGDDRDGEDPC